MKSDLSFLMEGEEAGKGEGAVTIVVQYSPLWACVERKYKEKSSRRVRESKRLRVILSLPWSSAVAASR